jgi:hypothetical protein
MYYCAAVQNNLHKGYHGYYRLVAVTAVHQAKFNWVKSMNRLCCDGKISCIPINRIRMQDLPSLFVN